MAVTQWGREFLIRLLKAWVDRLEIGRNRRREDAVERMRARGLRVPSDHRFDRVEANRR